MTLSFRTFKWEVNLKPLLNIMPRVTLLTGPSQKTDTHEVFEPKYEKNLHLWLNNVTQWIPRSYEKRGKMNWINLYFDKNLCPLRVTVLLILYSFHCDCILETQKSIKCSHHWTHWNLQESNFQYQPKTNG